MANTLLRLGLWTLILVLALYVVHETYSEESWVEMIPITMLQHILVVSVVLVGAGLVMRVLGVGVRVVAPRNRCRVCRTIIPSGAIYCREHLRSVLSDEDEKTHMTRVRK